MMLETASVLRTWKKGKQRASIRWLTENRHFERL